MDKSSETKTKPIKSPKPENQPSAQTCLTLDALGVGKSAIITKVGGEGQLRLRLLDMGLIPKTTVTLIKRAPMGDPIELRVRGYELTLRADDAKQIQIRPEETL